MLVTIKTGAESNYYSHIQEWITAEGGLYIRRRANSTWGEWQRCDNFGCNTAADLASLLGGLHSIGASSSSTNLKTMDMGGYYIVASSLGYPSDLAFEEDGFVICLISQENNGAKMFLQTNNYGSKLAIGVKWYSNEIHWTIV